MAAGLGSGLLGVGGGFLMVPAQAIWARTPQLKANATSLAAIIPISAVGVAVYYLKPGQHGHEADLRFAAILTVGAAFGAYLGARLVTRMPERQLKMAVAVLFLIVGLKQLIVPGA